MNASLPIQTSRFRIPAAPTSIEKGANLALLLDAEAVDCIAHNFGLAWPSFDRDGFRKSAMSGLAPLGIMQRGPHIARAMRAYLPQRYEDAVEVLLSSLTPPLQATSDNGMAPFFYHPHASFISEYGLDPAGNDGSDPFETSMRALRELTQRFTAEFAIRPFLARRTADTLARLMEWTRDRSSHVRRLCSEGARPRLPWAPRLQAFVADPSPAIPILEALKDDPELYVRRSVANHLGDIAKDHPERVFEICRRWTRNASPERKWLIRHALRHPAKTGVATALKLREAAR